MALHIEPKFMDHLGYYRNEKRNKKKSLRKEGKALAKIGRLESCRFKGRSRLIKEQIFSNNLAIKTHRTRAHEQERGEQTNEESLSAAHAEDVLTAQTREAKRRENARGNTTHGFSRRFSRQKHSYITRSDKTNKKGYSGKLVCSLFYSQKKCGFLVNVLRYWPTHQLSAILIFNCCRDLADRAERD